MKTVKNTAEQLFHTFKSFIVDEKMRFLVFILSLPTHGTTNTLTDTTPTSTPTPTRPTRLHPYVRHARFPREDAGVGVVECGLN